MSDVLGFDPGLSKHSWARLDGSGLLYAYTRPEMIPGLSPPGVAVIEWPDAQGYERVYAQLLRRAVALHERLAHWWPGVRIFGVPSNALRYKVAGWHPRNGGHADRAIRCWLLTHGFAAHCKRGGYLNSPDRRDALIAALWGMAVLTGRIEQPERWLLTTDNCQLTTGRSA